MKDFFSKRVVILIIGLVALAALVLVASALAALEFKSAIPFSVKSDRGPGSQSVAPTDLPLELLVYLAIALLFLLSILALVVMPAKQRKKFLLAMGVVFTLLIIMAIVTSMGREATVIPEPAVFTPSPEVFYEEDATPFPTILPSEYYEPQVDPGVSYAVALVVCLAVALLAWFLIIRFKRLQTPTLEEIAQDAIVEIQTGSDWSRSVEAAYLRMVETVRQNRGLNRRKDITPAEFAGILQQIGLPAQAVQRLTALFERVRYGGRQSTQVDIQEAVACLTEIVDACKEIEG